MENRPECVAVLGMHRAGTSAVAALMTELGFSVPGPANPPSADNPSGLFEPLEVVLIHEDFLHDIGRSWSDTRPLSAEDLSGVAAETARKRLDSWIANRLVKGAPAVIKDPRMCRLLPLWRGALDAHQIRPAAVLVSRSPISIAESLRRRNGLTRSRALLLWLRHVLEAEVGTRGWQRIWIRFEDLVGEERSVRPAAVQAFGELGFSPEELRRAGQRCFKSDLVHHTLAVDESLDRLRPFPLVATAYRQFSNGLAPTSAAEAFDGLREELAAADRLLAVENGVGFSGISTDPVWLSSEISHYRDLIEAQRLEIRTLRDEVRVLIEHVAAGITTRAREQDAASAAGPEAAMKRSARSPLVPIAEAVERLRREQARSLVELRHMTTQTRVGLSELTERQELVESQIAAGGGKMEQLQKAIATRIEGRLLTLLDKSLERFQTLEQDVWSRLSRALREKDEAVAGAEDRLRELREQERVTNAVRQELAAVRLELDQILNRRSWRYTSGLRGLYSFARSIFPGGARGGG